MKNVFSLFIVVFTTFLSSAQAPDYDDLKILYADGKYEKLISSAEKYTLKDNLKKDPYPFMWLSKGCYKMSISGTSDEKYKTAYKDALSAMSKVMKLDKDSSCVNTHREFVDELQMSLANMTNDAISSDKFKEASGFAVKYYKISGHFVGAKYIEAAAKFRSGDKAAADLIWKECDKILTATKSIESWTEADKVFFRSGVLFSADCYVNARQKDKAVTLLNKVAQWFEEDEEFKTRYNEIVN